MSRRRRGVIAWVGCLTALAVIMPSSAGLGCLWDRDSLAFELQGSRDALAALTGRFERNPPLYYEMRLARVGAQLAEHPDDLAAYDDAAVACDRLGRDDEAIEWMARKKARLDAAGSLPEKAKNEATYRYLANLGTFHAHRWLRAGADRSQRDDLTTARTLIDEALELNPDAHFGREWVQLRIIEMLIHPPDFRPGRTYPLPTFLDFRGRQDYGMESVRALTGLVTLGNAWESVDVYNALSMALEVDQVRTSLAMMARWRCEELIAAGKGSFVPGTPKGKELVGLLAPLGWMVPNEKALRETYQDLRREAEAWHEQRTSYLMERLRAGRHPDTDPDFWADFRDAGPPLRQETFEEAQRRSEGGAAIDMLRPRNAVWAIGGTGAAAMVLGVVWRRLVAWRRRPPVGHAAPDAP